MVFTETPFFINSVVFPKTIQTTFSWNSIKEHSSPLQIGLLPEQNPHKFLWITAILFNSIYVMIPFVKLIILLKQLMIDHVQCPVQAQTFLNIIFASILRFDNYSSTWSVINLSINELLLQLIAESTNHSLNQGMCQNIMIIFIRRASISVNRFASWPMDF